MALPLNLIVFHPIVKRCSEQERTNLKQNIQVELKRKLEYVKKGALLSAGKNDGGNREQL